ncbi:MAG: hypothetical protein R2746_09880 [Acidimicrobiales bacterium]
MSPEELARYGIRPNNRNRVFFKPGPGKVITSLPNGEVTVSVRYFKDRQAEARGRTVTWSFQVDLTTDAQLTTDDLSRAARPSRAGARTRPGPGSAPERLGLGDLFDAPGDAPTTTAVVFADTDPGDLPPRLVMAASASSRV